MPMEGIDTRDHEMVGVFSSGPNFDHAYGQLDALKKAVDALRDKPEKYRSYMSKINDIYAEIDYLKTAYEKGTLPNRLQGNFDNELVRIQQLINQLRDEENITTKTKSKPPTVKSSISKGVLIVAILLGVGFAIWVIK